jgi:heme exporter protein B
VKSTLLLVMSRELLVAFRRQSEILNPIWFFILAVTLFPLGLGPEPALLERVGPGVIWVAALLSSLLALERLFKDDFSDGSLEQMLIAPRSLVAVVYAKVLAHWILTGLPLILISPLLAVLLSMTPESWFAIVLTLLLGTPTLSFIGAIGVALTVGLRKGSVILSLLVLPLYIPVLIFATSAAEAASLNLPYYGQLAILAAIFTGTFTLSPYAVCAALRISTQ